MHDPGRVHKTMMSVTNLSAEMCERETRSCGKCSKATCIITDVENGLMVTRGKSGGTNWETGIDIYISIYKIDT